VRVLGLDPGFATTGFAVVDKTATGFGAVAMGALRTSASSGHAARLGSLFRSVVEVIEVNAPDVVAVERLFFNSNVRTAIAVGQASGAALAAAAVADLDVFEYTPGEVKQAVAGTGSAPKKQVQAMVAALLKLSEAPRPADAADACALAICHINRSGLDSALARVAR
jgi:crossover junction endodeoxyribonuclease RuvC